MRPMVWLGECSARDQWEQCWRERPGPVRRMERDFVVMMVVMVMGWVIACCMFFWGNGMSMILRVRVGC